MKVGGKFVKKKIDIAVAVVVEILEVLNQIILTPRSLLHQKLFWNGNKKSAETNLEDKLIHKYKKYNFTRNHKQAHKHILSALKLEV